MKRIIGRTFTKLICILMVASMTPLQALAVSDTPAKEYKAYKTEAVTVSPRADQIEWLYKVVDEVLYMRQYNYTRGEWVGDWIRVD